MISSKEDQDAELESLPNLPIMTKTFTMVRSMDMELQDLLEVICWKKRDILNLMINNKIDLLSTCMRFLLTDIPKVVTFQNKSKFFFE